MAKAPETDNVSFWGRIKQIALVFRLTAKRDKIFIPLIIVATAVAIGITLVLALWISWFAIPFGIMLVLLGILLVLNLRANKVFMAEAESQPGAAASIVENMRGDFRVTPAFASFTGNNNEFDFVHLVVCRAGIVLLGDGPNATRQKQMISQEKKRLSKVIGSADLRDIIIGHGEGEVPLRKLRMTLMRLPRTLAPKDVSSLDKRIKALNARPQMPKGAIPKSMRPPKGAFKATRGR
jgi:hypothetical protein